MKFFQYLLMNTVIVFFMLALCTNFPSFDDGIIDSEFSISEPVK